MTHDKLYSQHLHGHSQKKTHTPKTKNITNKQKMKQQQKRQPQGVIV